MKGLGMGWDASDRGLVCRWADLEEQEPREIVGDPLTQIGVSIAEATVTYAECAVGKAA
jgi:hypothetical protein